MSHEHSFDKVHVDSSHPCQPCFDSLLAERDKLKEDYAKLDCEFDIDHAEMKERAGQAYAKGFEDAREMAAGLVEKDHKFCSPPMCEIANKIRALRPSEGKEAK